MWPLSSQAANPWAAKRLSCTQQPWREMLGREHQVQALPSPSHRWQPTGEPWCLTTGSAGRSGSSAPENYPAPASSAASSLQHHNPPRQSQFSGYSCFSSQRGSRAALQQPFSSAFAFQRDFIPLHRGPEGQGEPGQGSRNKLRQPGTSPRPAGSSGADTSPTSPSWS